jgi:hypothetical protein
MYQLQFFPTPAVRVVLFPAERFEMSAVTQRTDKNPAIISG